MVRIDRLARSLAHLLEIVETLDARGAGFRSLGDPIDTTSPQGRFTLQILGAVADYAKSGMMQSQAFHSASIAG